MSVDVGNAGQTLPVTVTAPNGTTSNSATLTVVPPVPPPTVNAMSPNLIAPSLSVQALTIKGSGFVSGIDLQVAVGGITYSGAQITSVTSTQLVVGVSIASGCQLLPVQVTNPNGQTSNSVTLTVGTNSVNVADVQAVANQSLGASPRTSDLNHDGTVNVVDVQLAIASVLFSSCAATEMFKLASHRL